MIPRFCFFLKRLSFFIDSMVILNHALKFLFKMIARMMLPRAYSTSWSNLIASKAESSSWPILFVNVRISCINIFVTIPVVASVCSILISSLNSWSSCSCFCSIASSTAVTSVGLMASVSFCSHSRFCPVFSSAAFSSSHFFRSSASFRMASICFASSSFSFA